MAFEWKSGQAIPLGTRPRHLKANPDLADRHKTFKERAAFRLWCMRSVRSTGQRGILLGATAAKIFTRVSGHGKGGADLDKLRRRRSGLQGRPQKAPVLRGLLFKWFSVLRNSVAARIPPESRDCEGGPTRERLRGGVLAARCLARPAQSAFPLAEGMAQAIPCQLATPQPNIQSAQTCV